MSLEISINVTLPNAECSWKFSSTSPFGLKMSLESFVDIWSWWISKIIETKTNLRRPFQVKQKGFNALYRLDLHSFKNRGGKNLKTHSTDSILKLHFTSKCGVLTFYIHTQKKPINTYVQNTKIKIYRYSQPVGEASECYMTCSNYEPQKRNTLLLTFFRFLICHF